MSRSIRGDKALKRLCGRVAHEQVLTRASKRYHVLMGDVNSEYQPTSKGK